VRLNGYHTALPWGKVAQNISCDLVEGYIDESMRKMYEDVLLRFVPRLTHVPEAFVVMNAARTIVPEARDLLVVHLGGETTEIMLGDQEHLKRSASVPSGISSILRSIADLSHGDYEIAFSHLNMAARGSRLPTKKEQVAITDAIKVWKNDFLKTVHVTCGDNVPEQICFFTAMHDMKIAEYMLDTKDISGWSGKKHELVNLFGKKTFQHDLIIAAGANYVVE
jgi:hypothetical protein